MSFRATLNRTQVFDILLGPACSEGCGWGGEHGRNRNFVHFNAGRDYAESGWARLFMSFEKIEERQLPDPRGLYVLRKK